MPKIANWLSSLGLDKYTERFLENEIDFSLVTQLTDEDLRELDLPIGPRRKIRAAIDALANDEISSAGSENAANSPVGAERRHLTVMFCDLVSSTELSARFDPEDLSAIVRAFQNCCAAIVSRFEGYVARYMGDGMLVYFGYPQAHEDDAERAIRAGLQIVDSVARLEPRSDLKLETRIGLASGLVVVGESVGEASSREQVVMGETPNLAARLQALATPNSVVISEQTKKLAGEMFVYGDLGVQQLKGFEDSVRAHRVEGERAFESRFEAKSTVETHPIVGRDQELALLLERWRQARDGEGQMVLLSGEAGIGKSRISKAVVDRIAAEPHFRVGYQCSPYHTDSPLYPVAQQLRRAAGFSPGDSADEQLDKLEALLAQATQRPTEVAPLIASLLGLQFEHRYGAIELEPQRQRVRTLEALLAQLTGLAAMRPVLFVLEDAHWVDPSTLELLELCLDRVATTRVLMLVTARPTFDHGFGGHPVVTRLTLNRLGREQIGAIVERVLDGQMLGDDVVDEIALKTDGVPLFIEELTKAALDAGSAANIPASLHDSLMARLDRVPEVRDIAQIAAVIGRSFDHELLTSIADRSSANLEAALERLVEAELIFRRGKPPDARYTFKHALVRDAAYESLLKSRRQELHGSVARVLEERSGTESESQVELLAYHYGEAGLWKEAIENCLIAGNRSARRSANREAVGLIRRGLELVARLPAGPISMRLELELLMTLGGCLRTLKGWTHESTVDAVRRALALSEQLEGDPHGNAIGIGLYTLHLLRGQLTETEKIGYQLLDTAQQGNSNLSLYVGHRACGVVLFSAGRFQEARAHLDSGLSGYDASKEHDTIHHVGYYSGAAFNSYLSHTLWHLGFPDQARQCMQAAIDQAVEFRHIPTQAFACFQAVYHFSPMMEHDVDAMTSAVKLYRRLVGDRDFQTWNKALLAADAWLRCERGNCEEALETIREAVDWWKVNVGLLVVPWYLTLQADVQSRTGQIDEALTSLGEATDWVEKHGERWQLPEIRRCRGDVLARQPGHDVAAQAECYRQAIDIAREQSSLAIELRAATSLARLWANQGSQEDARHLLEPIYGRFTEGFETTDLRVAATLLKALS